MIKKAHKTSELTEIFLKFHTKQFCKNTNIPDVPFLPYLRTQVFLVGLYTGGGAIDDYKQAS